MNKQQEDALIEAMCQVCQEPPLVLRSDMHAVLKVARQAVLAEAKAELGKLPLVAVMFGARGMHVDAVSVRDTLDRLAKESGT